MRRSSISNACYYIQYSEDAQDPIDVMVTKEDNAYSILCIQLQNETCLQKKLISSKAGEGKQPRVDQIINMKNT
ncbi:hypothetical protein DPMN_154343 [Dreissena polymorpha]|uniref:Uncharacterized protein n=1 Tax=Dreissena polymorpha TaxID=45954 RepID=A0A9D4J9T5_DREPO|nr:hypothetical protein DPMN_154343 [Dreissena polymorpha]